jgi:DNA-directed RNA polymerase beta' subunit
VISPDVNIEPNEIGIPPVFARKLTFPEPVTAQNVHRMRELVIAGAKNYPGATMIEFEDGHTQFLVCSESIFGRYMTFTNITLKSRTSLVSSSGQQSRTNF